DGAAFGVIGGIDDTRNTRLNDGAGTHGARFEGDVQSGATQSVVAENASSFANHHYFGMGGWVVVTDGAVAGASNNRSILNEECANRNFSRVGRSARLGKSELHEI